MVSSDPELDRVVVMAVPGRREEDSYPRGDGGDRDQRGASLRQRAQGLRGSRVVGSVRVGLAGGELARLRRRG